VTRLALTIAAVSYLLGSSPFGYLLVRVFRGEDVRHTGSGNIGATNVARTGSKKLAIATLVLDALKGYAAVTFASWLILTSRSFLFLPQGYRLGGVTGEVWSTLCALGALFAILGHMFPVWLGFRGGKGVATAAGAFLALAPRALLLALLVFAIIVAITRYVSLASIVAVVAFPLLAWYLSRAAGPEVPEALLMTACSLLIVWRHKDNIRRLVAGTENRFR